MKINLLLDLITIVNVTFIYSVYILLLKGKALRGGLHEGGGTLSFF